jgi:hypothetical protein
MWLLRTAINQTTINQKTINQTAINQKFEDQNELLALVTWLKTFLQIEQLTSHKESEGADDIDLLRDTSVATR